MAGSEELHQFVGQALAAGQPRARIGEVLLKAGWEPEQVSAALDAYAEVDFPLPVPRPKPYLSARDAFMYLVLFTTLYISAYNLGRLVFQFINLALPMPGVPDVTAEIIRQAIRWSVSSLVIAFPIFLWLSRSLSRAVARQPAKRASKVRKWLTYMTLFFASGIIIGDLTYLLDSLLSGEMTLRFLLKALTVGVINGAIFGYYLWDLRSEEREREA